jgi:hypothetical protein
MGVQQRTGDRRNGTRTIRVDVPTADVASDLTWHLTEPAAISEPASERDGPQSVTVHTGSTARTIGRICDWSIQVGLTRLDIRVEGDGYRLTADWREDRDSHVR